MGDIELMENVHLAPKACVLLLEWPFTKWPQAFLDELKEETAEW